MEGGGDGTVRLGAINMTPERVFNNLDPDFSVSSPVTRQKAAAAKQFIENHYKNYLQGLQDRMERSIEESALDSSISSLRAIKGQVRAPWGLQLKKEVSFSAVAEEGPLKLIAEPIPKTP